MKYQRISPKTTAFVYDDIPDYLTYVYLIEKPTRFYLIDTYCGADSMIPVIDFIKQQAVAKEVVVINTHFHWDHIWGNTSFQNHQIISHELCRQLIAETWNDQFTKNHQHCSGIVEQVLPNMTFQKRLLFHDDDIELFYSPGHTIDSISIFDHEEETLYAGDNLEKPVVYVENNDLQTYIQTLEHYLEQCPKSIFAGHTTNLTVYDIERTVNYLHGIANGKNFSFETNYATRIHLQNLKTIGKI